MTIPIAPVAGLVAGLAAPPEVSFIDHLQKGEIRPALGRLTANYTGYNIDTGTWDYNELKNGLLPLFVGMIVHMAASRLGVNRMLGRARVPLIRV